MLSEDLKEDIEKLCEENNLTIDFNFNYPITVTIMKDMQTSLIDGIPEEAYLQFKFLIDQIDFNAVGDFKLDSKLLNKILNKVKKLHYIYLQEQYWQKQNRFKNNIKKMFDICNGNYVAIVNKFYEG